MSKKLCEICGKNPATVPDRNYGNIGRIVNRICSDCHGLRLRGDMKRIIELQAERQKK